MGILSRKMQEVLNAEHLLHHRHTKEGRMLPPLLELPTSYAFF